MLSPRETTRLKAEIQRLENAHKECTDSGIRGAIEAWIKEEKERLQSAQVFPKIVELWGTAESLSLCG